MLGENRAMQVKVTTFYLLLVEHGGIKFEQFAHTQSVNLVLTNHKCKFYTEKYFNFHKISKKICITLKNRFNLLYKTVLCKYFWATSKIRVMGIRAMENRVRRGMTV